MALNPQQMLQGRNLDCTNATRYRGISRMFAQFEGENRPQGTDILAIEASANIYEEAANSIGMANFVPSEARAWMRIQPNGTEVKRFKTSDPTWGDVIVWKTSDLNAAAGTDVGVGVQLYQEYPVDPAFYIRYYRGYDLFGSGEAHFGQMMADMYKTYNRDLAERVEGRKVSPAQARAYLNQQWAQLLVGVIELATSLPGSLGKMAVRTAFPELAGPIKDLSSKSKDVGEHLLLSKKEREEGKKLDNAFFNWLFTTSGVGHTLKKLYATAQ